MEQQTENLTQKDMLKEIMRDSKNQGQLIASLCTKMEGFQELQKQQNELILEKFNNRMDAADGRCERHNALYERRQAETGQRLENIINRLVAVENRPAEQALERNRLISKTVLVAILTTIGSLVVGAIIGWIAHNYAIG